MTKQSSKNISGFNLKVVLVLVALVLTGLAINYSYLLPPAAEQEAEINVITPSVQKLLDMGYVKNPNPAKNYVQINKAYTNCVGANVKPGTYWCDYIWPKNPGCDVFGTIIPYGTYNDTSKMACILPPSSTDSVEPGNFPYDDNYVAPSADPGSFDIILQPGQVPQVQVPSVGSFADVNGDGVVNFKDYMLFMKEYNLRSKAN